MLYGVDLAKKDIARRMQAVVVEGYTDVMACHLAGVETAIATCGTAFGDEHIKILRRLLMDQNEFRGEVVFTFDGDSAGQKAALKAFQDDQKFVTQTFVAVEPGGMDPCELRQHKGDTAVRDLVARRVPLFEFAIRVDDRHATTSTPPRAAPRRPGPAWRSCGRSGTCRCAATTPARSPAGSAWPTRTSWSAPPAAACARSGAGSPAAGDWPAPAPTRATRRCRYERDVLKVVLQAPALADAASTTSTPSVFTAPAYAAVHAAVVAAGGRRRPARAGRSGWRRSTRAAADDAVRRLVRELAVEPLPADDQALTRYATEVLARLEELAATRRIAEVKSRLQRLNPVEQSGRVQPAVRRAGRARGAPTRAARAGDRHAVMTSMRTQVNGTVDPLPNRLRLTRLEGQTDRRGGGCGPSGPRRARW